MPLKELKANLVPEIKELNVFVRKNLLSASLSGEIASSLKGRGIEFEDYRMYSKGDDASRIDWRASKRSRRLLVREYKIDININVFFIIDVSESMLFSSTKKLKCEYAAEVACSLFYGILQVGNSVGFGLFSDNMKMVNKPLQGKKQFYVLTKELSNVKNYGGEKDTKKALQQSLSILDKKGLIIIISDFINEDDKWIDTFKVMAQQHEVVGIMIRDPRDYTLPKNTGQIIIEDPFSGKVLYVDAAQYAKPYEEFNRNQINLINTVFNHNRASLLELRTDKEYLSPLMMFFRRRGGRWK